MSLDADHRFMAATDLAKALAADTTNHFDAHTERRVTKTLLKLLSDTNGEVQTQAVKCLPPLLKRANKDQASEIVGELLKMTADKQDSTRDIATLAIKTVIVSMHGHSGDVAFLSEKVIPRLFTLLKTPTTLEESRLDYLDLLSETYSRFGASIPVTQFSEASQLLLPLLSHPRAAMRKRTIAALAYASKYCSETCLEGLLVSLQNGFAASDASRRVSVQCIGSIARMCASRFTSQQLASLVPALIELATMKETEMGEDVDVELHEHALLALDSMLSGTRTGDMDSFAVGMLETGLSAVVFDPNYVAGEDEDEAMGDFYDGSDDELDDGGYSDDEDTTWKIRRSAAKLLTTIFAHVSHDFYKLDGNAYENAVKVLIGRVTEREENVRIEVIKCLNQIIVAIQAVAPAPGTPFVDRMDVDDDASGMVNSRKRRKTTPSRDFSDLGPVEIWIAQTSRLVKHLCKEMVNKKALQTRVAGFELLHRLVRVLPRGGLNQRDIALILPVVQLSLGKGDAQQTSANLKLVCLQFLNQAFKSVPASAFDTMATQFFAALVISSEDRFYRVAADSLTTCSELAIVLSADAVTDAEKDDALLNMFVLGMQQSRRTDVDSAVRKEAVAVIRSLCLFAPRVVAVEEACRALLDRSQAETGQVESLQALADILSQTTVLSKDVHKELVISAVDTFLSQLKSGRRIVRSTALCGLRSLLEWYLFMTLLVCESMYSQTNVFTEDMLENVAVTVSETIDTTDSALINLSTECVAQSLQNIMATNKAHQPDWHQNVAAAVVKLISSGSVDTTSPSMVFVSRICSELVRIHTTSFSTFVSQLLSSEHRKSHQATMSTRVHAAVVAKLCAHCSDMATKTNQKQLLDDLMSTIERGTDQTMTTCAALLTLGELGSKTDLAGAPNITALIRGLLTSKTEEIRICAAMAYGKLAVGNVNAILPTIMEDIGSNENVAVHYHALKEAIVSGRSIVASFAQPIWSTLLKECVTADESVQPLIVGCIEKLVLSDISMFLPEIQKQMVSESPAVRVAMVNAMRYSVTDPQITESVEDGLLMALLSSFFPLLQDSDMKVKHASFKALNSIIRHHPQLLLRDSNSLLDQIVTLVYQGTVLNADFIRMVDMGPFKVKVDEGLEARKAAFECMGSLLEMTRSFNMTSFIDRVVPALTDEHDVKLMGFMILARAAVLSPNQIIKRVDDLVTPVKATLDTKLKETAVKQEVEKNQELIVGALRLVAQLSTLDIPSSSSFHQLMAYIRGNGPLSSIFEGILKELKA